MRRMRFLLPLLIIGFIFIAGLVLINPSAAQGDRPTTPRSLDSVEVLVMPPVDVPALLAEDEVRASQGLPPRFAQPIPVDVNPTNHGTWETLANGTSLWRLRILSKGALSLNLGFTQYQMPEGGSLYLYTPGRSQIAGPFTAADNEEHGQLWSPILLGDELVIEVSLPAAQVPNLVLSLTSVNHGYAEFGRPHTITSGACNLDVVCSAQDGYPQVDGWRDPIRSVAVISTGGSTFCTGFLVNNTAQDLKGFFMTANHCGINSGNAPTLVTYWNYQNSWCRPVGDPINGQPGDGQLSQYNTGSYFRASYSTSDFTLVELDDPINPEFNLHWAGWDHSGADATNAVAIHHPNTDEKRISFEDQPTSVTSYLGNSIPGDGTHVRITDWDLGTTEPGSSGSPLFDQNQHVIGQLHGGYAACGNNDSDWYGRFYTSWTGGGNPNNRLSDWLDPLHTGQLFLDGRDVVETPFTVVADPTEVSICAPDPATYGITVTQEVEGYFEPVALSIFGVPDGAQALFSVNPVIPTFTSTLTISQTALAAAGSYEMDLVGVETTNTFTATITLNLFSAIPDLPSLLTPADGAVNQALRPTFTWQGAPFSSLYTLNLDTTPLFTQPLVAEGLTEPSYTPEGSLQGGTCYWWKVQSANACGEGAWTAPFHFATAALGVAFEDDIESGSANWTHQATQGADHWAISENQSHSPTHAWFVPDDEVVTDTRLWTTNPITVDVGSTLSFWHTYQFEGSAYDGSVLEISVNDGVTWNDLGDFITANGYNGTISSGYSNPLGGRQGWVGDLTSWTEVTVDLSSFAGQAVSIRWRLGSDSSVDDVGWFIDDVQVTSPLPPNPEPILISISPDSGNNLNPTAVVITGTNFLGTPALLLGDTWLESVVVVDPGTITAVVPAGIPEGVYDLALYNGDCQPAVLAGAFTVYAEDVPISGLTAANDSPTYVGSTTTFTATIEAGTNVVFTWDFGDGATGTGAVAAHAYSAPGNYTAVVTASNSQGSVTQSTEVVILPIYRFMYLPLALRH